MARKATALADLARKRGESVKATEKAFAKFREAGKAQDKNRPRHDDGSVSPKDRLATAQAVAKEIENEITRGNLLAVGDVDLAAAEVGAVIRGELLNLGNKLAGKLAGRDAVAVKEIIDAWAFETLTSWAKMAGVEIED